MNAKTTTAPKSDEAELKAKEAEAKPAPSINQLMKQQREVIDKKLASDREANFVKAAQAYIKTK